jgi:hypothetical protein
MDAALKTEIQEIVELVKIVPEPLQLRAFGMLFRRPPWAKRRRRSFHSLDEARPRREA